MRTLQKILYYQPTQRIDLGKKSRRYCEWRVCQFCQYDDLICHSSACGEYGSLNSTSCPVCGVMVWWEI